MSCKWSTFANSKILTPLVALLLVGCYQTLPPTWQEQIPGEYVGSLAGFRERVEFKPGGVVDHEVYKDGDLLVKESSKWNVPAGKYVIRIDSFTQFYNPDTRSFSTNGQEFVGFTFRPLPVGTRFERISGSVEFEFCLARKKDASK